MDASALPNRRVEAWKYSDLRAAIGSAPYTLREGRDIIERLAPATAREIIRSGETRLFVERLDGAHGLEARALDFSLEPGASLTRIVIQTGDAPVVSIARVSLACNTRFRQFVLAEGAKLARIETHVFVEGEGAEIDLNGVYMCGAGRHADLTSVVDHKVPRAQTRQLVKGVARKGGRGVFQGKIVVEHGAQKTDARQYHHGLLLEEGAEIFAKPELLIHADDVQCAHGNTAGGLDESALFYLRSRGVPERQARALVIEAFLAEAIFPDLPKHIDDAVRANMSAWLARG